MTTIEPTTELAVLKTDSRGRVLTPAEQRETLLDAFEQSTMSAAAFARLHGIRYPTFASWRQKRNRQRSSEPQSAQAGEFFEEVHFRPKETAGLTVTLPGGAGVKIERADQFPMVAALLQYLEHAC